MITAEAEKELLVCIEYSHGVMREQQVVICFPSVVMFRLEIFEAVQEKRHLIWDTTVSIFARFEVLRS